MDDEQTTLTDTRMRLAIQAATLCGRCQSATFMGWQDELDRLDEDSLPRGAAKNSEHDTWYMIRCDYFRMTVPQPEKLRFCDAFKVPDISAADD